MNATDSLENPKHIVAISMGPWGIGAGSPLRLLHYAQLAPAKQLPQLQPVDVLIVTDRIMQDFCAVFIYCSLQ